MIPSLALAQGLVVLAAVVAMAIPGLQEGLVLAVVAIAPRLHGRLVVLAVVALVVPFLQPVIVPFLQPVMSHFCNQ